MNKENRVSLFCSLVGFEYLKLFKRKSTYLALLIILLISTIANIGPDLGSVDQNGVRVSKSRLIQEARAATKALAGPVDEALIAEAISMYHQAYAEPNNLIEKDGKLELTSEADKKYIQHYAKVNSMIKYVYAAPGTAYDRQVLKDLRPEDAKDFYRLQTEKVMESLNSLNLSQAELQKHEEMNSQVTPPFTLDHFDAYTLFVMYLAVTGLFLLLAVSIALAPIFSSEYEKGSDQLILTSKYGKNLIIYAKLFTGMSFTLLSSLACLLLSLVMLMAFHGPEGAQVSWQVLYPNSTYPMTMLEAALTGSAIILSTALLIAAITLWLSSIMKASFGVIIATNLLIFVPLFINVSPAKRILWTLLKLFPTKLYEVSNMFSENLYVFFGKAYTILEFYPFFALLVIVVLLPLCYYAFKHRQIG